MKARTATADGEGNFNLFNFEVFPLQKDQVPVKIMSAGLYFAEHDALRWGKAHQRINDFYDIVSRATNIGKMMLSQ